MESDELRSLEDVIRVGSDLRHCWFRRHSTMVGSLLPVVHREPFCSARENIEFWAGQRFRLRAPSFAADLPKWDDYVSWLLLMQHHGVPTRLLDWTENVLVGLYFAVCESENTDGELWCMHHSELNWRSADWKACFPDTPPIRHLAAAAFLKADELAKFYIELGKPTIPCGPLALIPPFQFRRMAAQMSRFTIHTSKDPKRRSGICSAELPSFGISFQQALSGAWRIISPVWAFRAIPCFTVWIHLGRQSRTRSSNPTLR